MHQALGLFYLRRAARLYRALLAMLAVTVALGGGIGSALIAGTSTTNLFNSFGIGNSPYAHTWTLAMEEQFYLVWPFLLPVVSAVSYRFVERPFLRLKARLHPRPAPYEAQIAPVWRRRATSAPV